MSSISDVIEQFILSTMAEDNAIELSRNDLAKYFACVPSQINYVLNTRFTVNRGYVIESVRGGAGFVKVIKVNNGNNYLNSMLDICEEPMNFLKGCQMLDNLSSNKYLTKNESYLLKRAISSKSLNNPLNLEDMLRANILKEVIIELMKKG